MGAKHNHSIVAVPDILLPKEGDFSKWAVIACDQYTSQPEYWEELKAFIGRQPSTLRMILPETYLDEPDCDKRVKNIHRAMKNYITREIFETYHGFIYVRRVVEGRIRHGLIISIDLEAYDYTPGTSSPVRATEETIIERIPARVDIRRKAALEIPHIMLLMDDAKNTVLGSIKKGYKQMKKLYDFKLYGGERIEGYFVENTAPALNAFNALLEASKQGILLAVGDGNHSLAAAKALYEEQKAKGADVSKLRYALAEVVNLHDPALAFESINRVLFAVPEYGLTRIRELIDEYPDVTGDLCTFSKREYMEEAYRKNPKLIRANSRFLYMTLEISGVDNVLEPLQRALDIFLRESAAKIDYVHGDDVAFELGARPGNLCFVPPPLHKSDLMSGISCRSLPRKTFSMGSAASKRYYLESRLITSI